MRRSLMVAAFACFLVFVLAAPASAQTPRTISGTVLNPKAIDLPKPEYPEELRLAKIGGTARVRVTIDQAGNVVSAEPVANPSETIRRKGFGMIEVVEYRPAHPLPLEAARKVRFTRGPTPVVGVLAYVFALPANVH